MWVLTPSCCSRTEYPSSAQRSPTAAWHVFSSDSTWATSGGRLRRVRADSPSGRPPPPADRPPPRLEVDSPDLSRPPRRLRHFRSFEGRCLQVDRTETALDWGSGCWRCCWHSGWSCWRSSCWSSCRRGWRGWCSWWHWRRVNLEQNREL